MKKYSIDITINNSTDSGIPTGVHTAAGSFSISNQILAEHGATLISWGQLEKFSLSIGDADFDKDDISKALDGHDLHNGAGPGGTRPTCIAGIVFENGTPMGFFGELFIPVAKNSPHYNVSMGLSESLIKHNINFGTNPECQRGTIVASGIVAFRL